MPEYTTPSPPRLEEFAEHCGAQPSFPPDKHPPKASFTTRIRSQAAMAGLCLLAALPAQALYVTASLEVLRIPNQGTAWQTIDTQITYTSPVVVCTYNLPSSTDNEAVVRVRNIGPTSFQVRIQQPQNSAAVTASDVYCLVAEGGLHALADGRQFEAHTVLSDGTNGNNRGWGVGGPNGAENVSAAITGTYPPAERPVVLGQVMTYNDANFSAFWSFDCDNRRNPPFLSGIADGICVGKHVGQLAGASGNRANETLGYIVIEEGASPIGNSGGIGYRVDLGADTVFGVGDAPPYSYALGAGYDFAVATQAAMDGVNGGWTLLYGTAPLAGDALDLAIDEETVAGDTTRSHTSEQVAYWTFRGIDHGDAPASYGDAAHNVSGLLSIGTLAAGDADAEATQFSADANADDLDQLDDEDGIIFRSPAGGQSIFTDVGTTNRTGDTVTLCAWLDVPSGGTVDGTFDSTDGRCQTTSETNPTLTFEWPGLATDQPYSTFARFRLTSNVMTTANATGAFSDGEVEDYPVLFDFRPTAVSIGEVALQSQAVTEFLAALDVARMDGSELLALLSAWDPAQAAALVPADRTHLLAALRAYLDPDEDGRVAVLRWVTLEERGTMGFYVDRQEAGRGAWRRINGDMLPGLISAPRGGEYLLADPQTRSGTSYLYRLIEQEARGAQRTYGPWSLHVQ